MPFVRLRKLRGALTLTVKLTLWNTLVVLLVAIVALVSVREGLRLMLVKELESALEAEAYEIALSASHSPNSSQKLFDQLGETSAGHIRRGWFLQLFNGDQSQLLWSSSNTHKQFLSSPFALGEKTIEIEGQRYRLAESEVMSGNLAAYHVRVGTPLDFVQEDIDNVTRILLPVLVGVFLLAPLGGYILARRAIHPLQKIIAASRGLHPDRLEERLPLRNTGDELDQLSIEINQFLDQIAAYLARNREFVANAAHELRSPITALMTSVEVALNRPRNETEYEEILSTVQDECRHLALLANQLLLLAESDAGLLAPHATQVRLDQIVRTAVDMFTGVAEEKGVQLRLEVSPETYIMGDALRLRQVVNNLLDNALKFTPTGGSIAVRLKEAVASAEQPATVRLEVEDSGIGIRSRISLLSLIVSIK